MNCEILAPAGDELCARAALSSGADAIYLGLSRFSARSSAENFGEQSLRELITRAHLLGVKIYVCLNTLVKEEELGEFSESVRTAWEAGADAILMQDMLLGKKLHERYPGIVLHLSTQAGCCNERGAAYAKACGFSRAVLARETPLKEIGRIAKIIETEVFVQGALCTCFSGQCYLSSFAGNHSGNRGRCKQPCRKKYSIDRTGYELPAYALSPSDLSVGRKVQKLLEAGVVSLKIEGRMRRPEYVAAAVRYYRTLIKGGDAEQPFSDLKRAYNRGDYTEGLAFGQTPDFLSRKVQGHIGERVGYLKEGNFCESDYPAGKGDGFKILREGEEVGGASFRERREGGFTLSSREALHRGDEVRLTTDASLLSRLHPEGEIGERRRTATLSLRFVAGEPAKVSCAQFCRTYAVLEHAKSAPLTAEELKNCFLKTDGLPLDIRFEQVTAEGAFLPKSALNAIRRDFYSCLCGALSGQREPLPPLLSLGEQRRAAPRKEERRAVIAGSLKGLKADILIYKPQSYAHISAEEVQEGEGQKFLYLPPFLPSEEEALIAPALALFAGIYCDGYFGLPLAKQHGLQFFAGTGWNLTNSVSVQAAKEAGVDFLALSKELSSAEQDALAGEGVFALLFGGVKVMDLCYCPFEKNCKNCDRRGQYTLTDEEGRKFPLRRYRLGGESCRFELYNCAPLRIPKGSCGALSDLTGQEQLGPYLSCPEQAPLAGANRGHATRSVL